MSLSVPRCKVCGQSEMKSTTETCEYCKSRFIFFSQVITLRSRLAWERKTLQICKFQKEKILTEYFALDFEKKIHELKIRPDRILLLPSKDEKRDRDFHPACVLASRLAKKWKVTECNGIRKVSRQKQSGKKYYERFSHAKKAFEMIKKDRSWEGLHILIIDDIFTTGASLNEVSRMILSHGAVSVSCMVLLSNEGD